MALLLSPIQSLYIIDYKAGKGIGGKDKLKEPIDVQNFVKRECVSSAGNGCFSKRLYCSRAAQCVVPELNIMMSSAAQPHF